MHQSLLYVSHDLLVKLTNYTFCPHSVFMCFVWISEQTAIISLYSINWLVFITEMESVYCAVRTGSLYTTSLTFNSSTSYPHSVFMCFVWIWDWTAFISLCSINWRVFITETDCVYCAVRTETFNTIRFKFSLPNVAAPWPVLLDQWQLIIFSQYLSDIPERCCLVTSSEYSQFHKEVR
jgi:hypothetical protein